MKKSVTDTDTSFKAKSLQMPAQRLHATDSGDDDDSDGAEAAPTTTRRLTLPELITHLNHHNATVRKDALVGLRSLWIAYPTAVHAKMSAVIDAIGHRLADEDFDVRSTMYTLLESVAHSELLPSAVLQPFYKLLCIYLKGALSSIHHPIRMDALAFLAIFARGYPALVQCEGTQLLAALTPLLALSQHAMVTSTICHNIMPASLKLGKAGASTIQKACPRAKLSSQEARLVVAGAVTLVTLALLPSPHSAHSDDAIVDVASVAVRTLSTFNKSDADVSLPVTPVLTWTAAGSNASLLFRPLPASASAAFITSTSAALSSTSLMFTPDQTLGALVDLLAELDPASAHAASKYVVARMCTCMSALGAWWLYEVQTCGKPTLAWTAALFAGLERTVLPHFPFESSDIMTEAGSQHLAGLNVRACLLLTMCLPPHSLHDAAMTNALAERTHVKGCKLSFHWIPAVVAVLKETLEGSHSGLLSLHGVGFVLHRPRNFGTLYTNH